jgi:hypothetical protein
MTYYLPAGCTLINIYITLLDLFPAPPTPYHIYDIYLSIDKNILIDAGFCEFLSAEDVEVDRIHRFFGKTCGYGNAYINFIKGVKTVEGRYYAVTFINWDKTNQPYRLNLEVHGIVETIAGE